MVRSGKLCGQSSGGTRFQINRAPPGTGSLAGSKLEFCAIREIVHPYRLKAGLRTRSARLWLAATIAGNNPITKNFIRRLDRIGVENKLTLARVLCDELEAEMKVFEAPGA